MSRILALALSAAIGLMALPTRAEQLMTRFAGEWVGTGQLLYGPRNTIFRCELKGDQRDSQGRFDLTGRCWMGDLSAAVSAQLRYNADTMQYYGAFMDGAEGQGADITGAGAGGGLSLRLVRGNMQGRLTAEKVNADQMKVMLFYNDPQAKRELPVAAMGFARPDANSLPDYMPSFVTGSIAPRN
jgi:hypothetical protein